MKNYKARMRMARIINRNVRIFEDTAYTRELMKDDADYLRHLLTHRALRFRNVDLGGLNF